jgi:hypothetical protein
MAFVFQTPNLSPESAQAFKLVCFVIFLAASTLFIGFNHQMFTLVMGERSRSFWWLFVIIALVPLLLVLYAFSIIFGNIFA